jgi:hypothetical protein
MAHRARQVWADGPTSAVRPVTSEQRGAGGAWSVMENNLGNLAPGTTGQLVAAMRHQLDHIQRWPAQREHYRPVLCAGG